MNVLATLLIPTFTLVAAEHRLGYACGNNYATEPCDTDEPRATSSHIIVCNDQHVWALREAYGYGGVIPVPAARRSTPGLYEKMILTPGSSVSYAWINYDVDIVHYVKFDETYERLAHCGNRIQRLQVPVNVDGETWCRNRSTGLMFYFRHLEEYFVIMTGRTNIWHWRLGSFNSLILCPANKIHLIGKRSNERMTLAELIQMSDEDVKEWIERDWKLYGHLYVSDESEDDD